MPMSRNLDVARVVDAEPIFVSVLGAGGFTASTRTSGAGPLPQIRVTYLRDSAAVGAEWADAVAQIDVWAVSEDAAGVLAASVATYWRSLLHGDVDDAYVSGAWVSMRPRPLDDPSTDLPRVMLEVALRIHPKETSPYG